MSEKTLCLNNINTTRESLSSIEKLKKEIKDIKSPSLFKTILMSIFGPLLAGWILYWPIYLILNIFIRNIDDHVPGIITIAILFFTPYIIYVRQKTRLSKIPNIAGRRNELTEKLNNLESDLRNSEIPETYRIKDILDRFDIYLKNGRAENLKECINLYHDELHKEAVLAAVQSSEAIKRENERKLLQEQQRSQTDILREQKRQTYILREQRHELERMRRHLEE